MGVAFDIAGSYRNALIGFEVASLGTLALIAWLPAVRLRGGWFTDLRGCQTL